MIKNNTVSVRSASLALAITRMAEGMAAGVCVKVLCLITKERHNTHNAASRMCSVRSASLALAITRMAEGMAAGV